MHPLRIANKTARTLADRGAVKDFGPPGKLMHWASCLTTCHNIKTSKDSHNPTLISIKLHNYNSYLIRCDLLGQ